MGKLTFVALYSHSDGVDGGFYGEVKTVIEAEDFIEASKIAQAFEAKMEGIQFTLLSVEYQA